MTENVYAKMAWLKRFNNVSQTAYLGALEGKRVFAVGVMGSVTIDVEDIPHLVRQLRDLTDALEKYHRDHPPVPGPPQPARTRETRRGKASGGKRCQQPSTRGMVVGSTEYTTCDTPLTEDGLCANAGKHVVL